MRSKFLRFIWLFIILLWPSLAWESQAPSGPLKIMPPHPRLQEQVRQGVVKVPDFTAMNRAVAKTAAPFKVPLAAKSALKAPATSLKALAVLVDFSDHVHTVTASFFDSLLFAAPGTGHSVRDFYNQVSYGQVDVYTVNLPSSLGWKRAPSPYTYYVNNGYGTDSPYPHNCQKLAEDIVDALHTAGVDFSQYASGGQAGPIMLIHSGPGAEFTGATTDIWSHSWVLNTPRYYNNVTIGRYVVMPEYWQSKSASSSDMTIGVFCHEMGHGFWDLPDLYDTTYNSEGIGYWSLMAGGSWNGAKGLGESPAWPDAYCRVLMGFVTPVTISGSQTGVSIPQVYNNAAAQTVLKLASPFNSKEYWLVENRQKTSGSYDYYLPGAGLLIWHVDENMSSNDHVCTQQTNCSCGSHYLVALEQADGYMDLEYGSDGGDTGDPFPGSRTKRSWSMSTTPSSTSYYNCGNSNISVTNISNSGATMTADITAGANNDPAAISLSPTTLSPSCLQGQNPANQSFQVWDSGGQTLNYTVSSNANWLAVNPTSGSSTGTHNTHQVTYSATNLTAGIYQATITVSASGVSNSPQTILVTLTVGTAAPKAIFTASPTSGYAPLAVQFTDSSTGTITGRTWDFGDGDSSGEVSPSHTYQTPGAFTATLVVTGPGGTSSKSVKITVKKPPKPKVSFTAAPKSGIYPLAVQFTDTSTGNITGRVWDFGDGSAGSTEQTVSHTYVNPGTYRAKLTVTGLGGTSTKTVTISAKKPPKPKVSLTATPTTVQVEAAVQFNDTSTGDITGRVWDFGDGNTSTEISPSHAFGAKGSHRVKLTVTGRGGSSYKYVTIKVTAAAAVSGYQTNFSRNF